MTPAGIAMAVLWLLGLAVPTLLALSAAAALRPGWARPIFIVLAALTGVLLAGVLLVAGLGGAVEFATPLGPPGLGPPGLGTRLRLDPMACAFLIALLLPAAAASLAALEAPAEGGVARFATLLGLGLLALLAGSPFLMIGAVAGLAMVLVRADARDLPAPLAALAFAGLGLAVLPGVAVSVLLRAAPDAVPPPWAGTGLMVVGALGALAAGRQACRLDSLTRVPAALAGVHLGVIAAGIGLVLLARTADLPPLAGAALAAVLLHAMGAAVVTGLMLLAAGMLARGAGTAGLDRLGGLVQPMAVTGGCLLAGGAASLMVPPAPVFASAWLLFQALFMAPRAGGMALGAVLGLVAAGLAGALALAGAAVLRLVGVALLGRPRTPRAAAALEAGKPARAALLGLAACAVLLGVLPGFAAALVAPAAHGLAGGGLLALRPAADTGGYGALAVTVMLLAALGLGRWVLRHRAAGGQRWSSAWNGGFAAPPPWLPFGEPEAQPSAAALADVLAPPRAVPRPGRAWIAGLVARRRALALVARGRALAANATPADLARVGAMLVLASLAALFLALAAA